MKAKDPIRIGGTYRHKKTGELVRVKSVTGLNINMLVLPLGKENTKWVNCSEYEIVRVHG